MRARATASWSQPSSCGLWSLFRMMRIRPEKPRFSHSIRWPSTSFAHHSPSAGWNPSTGAGSADSSAWITAPAECSSAATACGLRGSGVIAVKMSECKT